ncbi:OsmC family protein [Chitinophaga sp. S165]|uniref:OsmC family protein n=1 Tax=Chitinophaga sp. S165 TaxID=2135462 RepID=UPI000D71190B|nr:OsmC family protein [Chitinophaga sp. S165]PWV48271.1 organic hydroperoxide reductase OsmC/OhrA [Chitinophaga sp. S165]
MKAHHYTMTTRWTGNTGSGTASYQSYERSHVLQTDGKPEIPGSSDPSFRGDKTRYNPEEMLVASLSSCHMLWYLHLCSAAGIVVIDYVDHATGTMTETADGGGYFSEVTLHPEVTITDASLTDKANELHHEANELCFIANSVKFPVHHQPTCKVQA